MNYIEIIYAFFATIFFCIIFNLSPKKLIYSGIAGVIGWYVYMHFRENYSIVTAFLISSIAITIYSEILSKILKTTTTVLLIPALIPLVPGSGIYFTMSNLVQEKYTEAFSVGMQTLFVTVAITVGIVLVTTIAQIIYRIFSLMKYLKQNKLKIRRGDNND